MDGDEAEQFMYLISTWEHYDRNRQFQFLANLLGGSNVGQT